MREQLSPTTGARNHTTERQLQTATTTPVQEIMLCCKTDADLRAMRTLRRLSGGASANWARANLPEYPSISRVQHCDQARNKKTTTLPLFVLLLHVWIADSSASGNRAPRFSGRPAVSSRGMTSEGSARISTFPLPNDKQTTTHSCTTTHLLTVPPSISRSIHSFPLFRLRGCGR